jgi:hypothetical protein
MPIETLIFGGNNSRRQRRGNFFKRRPVKPPPFFFGSQFMDKNAVPVKERRFGTYISAAHLVKGRPGIRARTQYQIYYRRENKAERADSRSKPRKYFFTMKHYDTILRNSAAKIKVLPDF